MNITAKCFPETVHPVLHEAGVYLVDSNSRKNKQHKIDVAQLRCNCERDQTHGNRTRKQLGYYPHTHWCKHLRASMIYHGLLVTLAAAEQELNRGNQKQREPALR